MGSEMCIRDRKKTKLRQAWKSWQTGRWTVRLSSLLGTLARGASAQTVVEGRRAGSRQCALDEAPGILAEEGALSATAVSKLGLAFVAWTRATRWEKWRLTREFASRSAFEKMQMDRKAGRTTDSAVQREEAHRTTVPLLLFSRCCPAVVPLCTQKVRDTARNHSVIVDA